MKPKRYGPVARFIGLFMIGLAVAPGVVTLSCDTPTTSPKRPQFELTPVDIGQFWWKGHDCKLVSLEARPLGCKDCYWQTELRFLECDGQVVTSNSNMTGVWK